MTHQWRKSSHSGATQGTDCVELADLDDVVGLRDSKFPERGHLTLSREALASLVQEIKSTK